MLGSLTVWNSLKRSSGGVVSKAALEEYWKDRLEQDDEAFLTMRQLRPREVSASEAKGPGWDRARDKEWSSWKTHKVYKKLPRLPPNVKATPCRWVYCVKDDGSLKARLTVRGDIEKRRTANDIRTDSPTASRKSVRLFCALTAQLSWHMESFDVPTAFLQQSEIFNAERGIPLYLKPPRECWEEGDDENTVWLCLKTPYGCADAPRAWFASFQAWAKTIGGQPLPLEPCVLTFRNQQGQLEGHVVLHVDDGMMAGTEEFLRRMRKHLREKYSVGTFSRDRFKFCGLWLSRSSDGTISMSQEKYCDMIEPIKVTRHRAAETSDQLTDDEVRSVQAIAGSINWLATQTRPDLSLAVSELVGILAHDKTVRALKHANKVVSQAHTSKSSHIIFRRLPCSIMDLSVRVYTDASWANMPGLRSQSGQVFVLSAPGDDESFKGNAIHWRSSRIKRVCRSTFAAETLSFVDAMDEGIATAQLLQQWIRPKSEKQVEVEMLTDCRSLVDSMQQISPSATEKRLELDLLSIKENIEQLGLKITWIDTKLQVADPLTKRMDTMNMMTVLMKGIYERICELGYPACEKLTSAQHYLITMLSLAPPDTFDVYG